MADTQTSSDSAPSLPTGLFSATDLDSLVNQAKASPDTSALSGTVKKLQDVEAARASDPDIEKTRKGMARDFETDKARSEKSFEGIEPVNTKPWTAERPQPEPMRDFGSFASVFAQIASAFTHQPMTNALNAGAAAMNAARNNDLENYKSAYEAWKENTKLALERHTAQYQDYQAASDKMKTDSAAGSAMLTALAAKYGDQSLALMNQAGLESHIASLQQGRQTAAQGMLRLMPELEKEGERRLILMQDPDWLSKDPLRMASAEQRATQAMSPYVAAMGDPKRIALNAFIAQYQTEHNGEYPPAQAIAAFNASNAPVRSAPAMAMRKFMEENPGADSSTIAEFGANYAARSKAVSAFATGKQGDIVRSFSTVAEHLESLDRAATALDNGDIRVLNNLANTWAREQGKPAPTDFKTVKDIVAAEIVKAIVGAGGTGGDRDHARSVIDDVNSPDQIHGAVNKLRELVHGQLVGLEKQYVDTTTLGVDDPEAKTKAREAFRGRLSGKAQSLYEENPESKSDLEMRARQAWGSYEPSKYDYRIDPATGQLQRKAKE